MTYPLTPERKAENDAAIAAYESAELSGDPVRIWETFARVEQCMNAEFFMQNAAESERIRKEKSRIIRERNARNAALKPVEASASAFCDALMAPYRQAAE